MNGCTSGGKKKKKEKKEREKKHKNYRLGYTLQNFENRFFDLKS